MSDLKRRLTVLLEAEGLSPNSDFHSWRCSHPDRFGECTCVEELAEAIMVLVKSDEA